MVIPPNTSPAFLTYCPTFALMLTEVSGLSIMVPTPPPKLLKILSSAVSKSFTKSPPSHSSRVLPFILSPPSPSVWEILSTKKVPSTPGSVLNPINKIILLYCPSGTKAWPFCASPSIKLATASVAKSKLKVSQPVPVWVAPTSTSLAPLAPSSNFTKTAISVDENNSSSIVLSSPLKSTAVPRGNCTFWN